MEAPDIRVEMYNITKGKPFTYNGVTYDRYSVDEKEFCIKIFPKDSSIASQIYFDSAETFLKNINKQKISSRLQTINHSAMENNETSLATTDEMKVTINGLKNILMDTIEKVQNDGNYCKQANSINISVNTLINLAKLSMQLQNE